MWGGFFFYDSTIDFSYVMQTAKQFTTQIIWAVLCAVPPSLCIILIGLSLNVIYAYDVHYKEQQEQQEQVNEWLVPNFRWLVQAINPSPHPPLKRLCVCVLHSK